MRLLRRTLVKAGIVQRSIKEDGLGGVSEDFSGEVRFEEAALSYVANTLSATGNNIAAGMYGVVHSQSVRLRMRPECGIKPGDGVMLPGDDGVAWRCVQVDRYPNVAVARIEKIAGDEG